MKNLQVSAMSKARLNSCGTAAKKQYRVLAMSQGPSLLGDEQADCAWPVSMKAYVLMERCGSRPSM